jgi:PAS domain S-box-containing protein
MNIGSRSLLDFLDAPVVVGDPDGRAVYTNPAFDAAFGTQRERARGESLASLFQGGGREAMLRAVAQVCGGSSAIRFRLRDGELGYSALASPIEVEQGRVGVLILLVEEVHVTDLVPLLQREVEEPLDEIARCLGELSQQLGRRADPSSTVLLEDAARALGRLRKRCESWRTYPSASR